MPHSAQSQHTNHWAPRTRKRHQQEHRPQRPTERSDPTQHAKGRTGDCPGPRKGATTRRNVTRGGGWPDPPLPPPPPSAQTATATSGDDDAFRYDPKKVQYYEDSLKREFGPLLVAMSESIGLLDGVIYGMVKSALDVRKAGPRALAQGRRAASRDPIERGSCRASRTASPPVDVE